MSPGTVLVTGAAGFIGSNFVRALLQARPEVRVLSLDLLTYAGSRHNLDGLPDRHALIVGDIADPALLRQIFAEHAPDAVVHFAAESHVDRSLHAPEAFLHSNVQGTFALLEAARQAWAPGQGHFHHVSTDEVYGDLAPDAQPCAEGAPYRPSSPYSATKAASDHLVAAWGRSFGLRVTTTLSCNIYGPRQLPEKLIPLMILKALQGEPLPIYGDGQQRREWLHVEDQCAAVLAVLEGGQPGAVYHVSSAESTRNLDLVRRLCALLDERHPAGAPHARLIRHVADRPGHDQRYALDPRRIQSELGWRPRHALDGGLAQTVDWYLDNPGWLEAIRDRPSTRDWLARHYG